MSGRLNDVGQLTVSGLFSASHREAEAFIGASNVLKHSSSHLVLNETSDS